MVLAQRVEPPIKVAHALPPTPGLPIDVTAVAVVGGRTGLLLPWSGRDRSSAEANKAHGIE